MKRFFFQSLLSIAILFNGCVSYHFTRPIFPASINPGKELKIVTSLQPLLSWEPASANYDVIIHEVRIDSSKKNNIKRLAGNRVYYRENISGNSHVVQAVLKPDTEYCWSLRIRDGGKISEWASFDYRTFLFHIKTNGAFYMFKTPYLRPLTFEPFNPIDHW
jgi:hypothetical protein